MNIRNKYKHIMLKLIIMSLFLNFFSVEISSQDNVIKVGFSDFAGISFVNEDGNYAGIVYDYLMEISKYNGWKYEFVLGNPEEILQMLINGEIDVVGGILYDETYAKNWYYPAYNSGMSYVTLSVAKDNTKIMPLEYETFDGMTVGAFYNSTKKIEELEAFCEANNIRYNLKIYDDLIEYEDCLVNNEVDVRLGGDLSLYIENEHIIAVLSSQPYYFAISKERPDLVVEFNRAISSIINYKANFEQETYNKYFGSLLKSDFYLTNDERISLRKSDTIKVASVNREPIYYFDTDGNFKGIASDIFNKISELTGLKFKFIKANSNDEVLEMIENGIADIGTNIQNNYNNLNKHDIIFTESYLTPSIVVVKTDNNKKIDYDKSKFCSYPSVILPVKINKDNMFFVNDYEEAFEKINKGIYDYTFCDNYVANYFIKTNKYNNINISILPNSFDELSLTIRDSIEKNILRSINKSIRYINNNYIQSYIFDNTLSYNENLSLSYYINKNPILAIKAIVCLLIFIFSVVFIIVYNKMNYQKSIIKHNERYYALERLSDDIIVEYNYKDDILLIPQKQDKLNKYIKIKNYINDIYTTVFKEDADILKQHILGANEANKIYKIEFRSLQDEKYSWYSLKYVVSFDEKGNKEDFIGKIKNIDDKKHIEEVLKKRAFTDSMTNLLNKNATADTINDIISKNESGFYAMFIIDIDDFKFVNDNFGHLAGDGVIKSVAKQLQMICDKNDVIGRIGGDEFLIFAKFDNKDLAIERGHNLCEGLHREYKFKKQVRVITCSIGMSCLDENGNSYIELFDFADKVMYKSKKDGKSKFSYL